LASRASTGMIQVSAIYTAICDARDCGNVMSLWKLRRNLIWCGKLARQGIIWYLNLMMLKFCLRRVRVCEGLYQLLQRSQKQL